MTRTGSAKELWKPALESGGGRRARRRVTRVNELLRTTAEVVAERGYHGASLEEIAERLNLGKPAVYHYYASKEALVLTCLETCHSHVVGILSAIASSDDLDPRERLRAMIVQQLKMICVEYPELSHLFLHPLDWPPTIETEVRRWRKQHDRVFRAVVESGIAQGGLRPHDPQVARMCLHGALNHAPLWLRGQGARASIEVVADTVMEMFVPGESGTIG